MGIPWLAMRVACFPAVPGRRQAKTEAGIGGHFAAVRNCTKKEKYIDF